MKMIRRSAHETSNTTVYAKTQRRLHLHSSKKDKNLVSHSTVEDKSSITSDQHRETTRKTSRKTLSDSARKIRIIKKKSKVVITTSHHNIF
jgi:hypothetical protein